MYEVEEIQDYQLKWLEVERDLAINWAKLPSDPFNSEPIDHVDEATERVKRNLEDYQPGASRALVLDALKKVSKSTEAFSEVWQTTCFNIVLNIGCSSFL